MGRNGEKWGQWEKMGGNGCCGGRWGQITKIVGLGWTGLVSPFSPIFPHFHQCGKFWMLDGKMGNLGAEKAKKHGFDWQQGYGGDALVEAPEEKWGEIVGRNMLLSMKHLPFSYFLCLREDERFTCQCCGHAMQVIVIRHEMAHD